MNRKLGLSLFALLAVFAIGTAAPSAAAVEASKAPVTLEELFAPAPVSPVPSGGVEPLFVPLASGCTTTFCTSNAHCRQLCGDPAVACVSQLGTKRCIYL